MSSSGSLVSNKNENTTARILKLTCIKAPLPMFYFLSTARHTIKSFLFAAFKVEITRDMLVAIFGENEIKQTYSTQRYGKAGIQNSVLSLQSSSRLDILVFRDCSMTGRLITEQA